MLFKNKWKDTKTKPDFKGWISLNDPNDHNSPKLYDAAGWMNEGKSGEKYIKITFSDIWVKPETKDPKEEELIDDDIPF